MTFWTRAVQWTLWFIHVPFSLFWLIIGSLLLAAVVTLFVSPRHAFHLLELAGVVFGVVKLLAAVRGIPAWRRQP